MVEPFITFYTPTYKRPQALARCLASVAAQTAVADIEQLVVVDHVGQGVAGMFARVPTYVDAVHGLYIHMLADDDELAAPDVVETVRAFAQTHDYPKLILVWTVKGGCRWPLGPPWPPRLARIDLNCAIVRRDVWRDHAYAFGWRYEGDFDFLNALHVDGVSAAWCDLLFSTGAVSRGRPELNQAGGNDDH
jgi:hypothetical protein